MGEWYAISMYVLGRSFHSLLGCRGGAVRAEVELACAVSAFEAYGRGLDFIGFELRSNAHSCDEAA
jgi:hypothetical protein